MNAEFRNRLVGSSSVLAAKDPEEQKTLVEIREALIGLRDRQRQAAVPDSDHRKAATQLSVKDASGNSLTEISPNAPVAVIFSTGPNQTADSLNGDGTADAY